MRVDEISEKQKQVKELSNIPSDLISDLSCFGTNVPSVIAEREIVPEYPDEAVREALINALCHRDYASVGTVQVRIYDDRLEVWNPGRLPPDLSIEALYRQHASHPQNPRLAHALYRARLIEHWGTGTLWGKMGSPIKRHLSREKSIPGVRGLSSSPSVVRIGVGETNQ